MMMSTAMLRLLVGAAGLVAVAQGTPPPAHGRRPSRPSRPALPTLRQPPASAPPVAAPRLTRRSKHAVQQVRHAVTT